MSMLTKVKFLLCGHVATVSLTTETTVNVVVKHCTVQIGLEQGLSEDIACSPHSCVGFLLVLWFPPPSNHVH